MPKGISKRLAEQRRLIAKDIKDLGDRVLVAEKWECSLSYINQCCRQFGIRTKTNLTHRQVVAIVADLLANLTYKQIESKHNVGRTPLGNINKYCKEAGMDTGRNVGRPKRK